MTVYAYEAVDERGLKHKGVLSADSERQLRQQLRTRGWIPLHIKDVARDATYRWRRARSAFSHKELTGFTRELAILIEGGLPLEKALKLIIMQTQKLQLREHMLAIHSQIVSGSSFAASLEAQPENFPALYRTTIAAGEKAGDLSGVLNKLADYGETHQRTMTKVKLAMMYPVILSLFSLVAVTGLLTFIFPDIAQIFIQSGKPLPMLTRVLIALSDFLRHYGAFIIIAFVLAAAVIRRAFADPATALKLHKKLMGIPLIGSLIMAVNLTQFTSTLSMLHNSGLPLTEAIHVASNVLSNLWLRKAAQQVEQDVISGSTLSQALTLTKTFPPAFISLISGGEESGELDHVLALAARNQMREMENRVLYGVAILEPVIILVMGMMVLLVVLAIMMPILSINQLVK